MKLLGPLVVASAAIASCTPTPAPPAASPPVAQVQPPEGSALDAPASPAPTAAVLEDAPQLRAVLPIDPDPWAPCAPAVVEQVRASPAAAAGEVTTVGARLDGGAIPAALPGMSLESAGVGQWVCRDGESGHQAQFRAEWRGATFGPVWTLGAAQADGVPPRPQADNLLAEVVEATWEPAADAPSRAIDQIESWRSATGASVAEGLFVTALSDEEGVASDAGVQWGVLPGARVRGVPAMEVTAAWRSGEQGRRVARWLVRTDGPGVLPANELGAVVLENAAAIPTERPAVGPAEFRPRDPPSSAGDPVLRAASYLFAHAVELRTVAAQLAFVERLTPYTAGPWVTTGPSVDGRVSIAHEFRVGDEGGSIGWTIDPQTGETEPRTELARLARSAQPRYRPGLDADLARTLPPELATPVLDAHLSAAADAILACADGSTRLQISYTVMWEGRIPRSRLPTLPPQRHASRML